MLVKNISLYYFAFIFKGQSQKLGENQGTCLKRLTFKKYASVVSTIILWKRLILHKIVCFEHNIQL